MFPGQEQSALKSHKKAMHHEIVETPCPECGKVFLSAFKMKYHLSTAHNTATEGKLHLTMSHNLGVWKSYGQRLVQCFSFNFFQTSKKVYFVFFFCNYFRLGLPQVLKVIQIESDTRCTIKKEAFGNS